MQTELNTTRDTEVITYFADVILPVPIPKLFTYRVPLAMNDMIQVGCRVIVQFGSKKVLTAVIAHIHRNPPTNYKAKYLLELLDDVPMVTPQQIEMFQWMAGYYMCYIGEVLNVALPSGLKISSQSKIQLNPNADLKHADLSHNEQRLVEALQEAQSLSYTDAADVLGVKNIYQLIKSLISKDVVLVFEEVKERYQPKKIKKIRLLKEYVEKQTLDKLSKSLENKTKQHDILLNYLRHVPVYKDWTLNDDGLAKSAFTKNETLSKSALQTLIKNKIFEEFEIIVSRFEEYEPDPKIKVQLSERQQEVSGEIMLHFENKNVVLLHGVTGSGKTEIYIDPLVSGTLFVKSSQEF